VNILPKDLEHSNIKENRHRLPFDGKKFV